MKSPHRHNNIKCQNDNRNAPSWPLKNHEQNYLILMNQPLRLIRFSECLWWCFPQSHNTLRVIPSPTDKKQQHRDEAAKNRQGMICEVADVLVMFDPTWCYNRKDSQSHKLTIHSCHTALQCERSYFSLLHRFSFSTWLVVAWCSGNTLVVINEVTLHRAQLVLGWVTVCGQVNHLGM